MAKYTQKRKLLKVKSRKNNKTGKRLKRRVKHKGGDAYIDNTANSKVFVATPETIKARLNTLKPNYKLVYYEGEYGNIKKTEPITNIENGNFFLNNSIENIAGRKYEQNTPIPINNLFVDINTDYNNNIENKMDILDLSGKSIFS